MAKFCPRSCWMPPYKFSTRKIQVQNMLCTKIVLFWHSKQFLYTTWSELVFFSYWTCNSMNNLLSYCGLTDARISASKKDLPVNQDSPDWCLNTSQILTFSLPFWPNSGQCLATLSSYLNKPREKMF